MGSEAHFFTILSISRSLFEDLLRKEDEREIEKLARRAYRRALLRHHPDKNPQKDNVEDDSRKGERDQKNGGGGVGDREINAEKTRGRRAFSVDEITAAYKTLASPTLGRAYLHSLSTKSPNGEVNDLHHTGLEAHDLDDLDYDSEAQVWYLSCRCGNPRGYVVREKDLEEEVERRDQEEGEVGGDAEILVGCRDCSLWIGVGFAVVEE